MRELFNNSQPLNGDCFVADYTDMTGSKRGVEISETPFEDITYFHLKKHGRGDISYQAINLEKYPSFIKGIDNCECIFNALSKCRRPWLLFLETKYCHKEENIDNYPVDAHKQMAATLKKLVDLGKVDVDSRRIYFVFSVPPFPTKEPFGSFVTTQSEALRLLEEKGVVMLGYNSMLILTTHYLKTPDVRI